MTNSSKINLRWKRPVDYISQMEKVVQNAKKYGQMTSKEKRIMCHLIRANGNLPSGLRSDVWMLASAAERSKRNHPDYYIVSEHKR